MSFEDIISEIPTEDLIKEVNKRKSDRLPVLIEQINSAIKQLESFGLEIKCEEDKDFKLYEVFMDTGNKLYYINAEVE